MQIRKQTHSALPAMETITPQCILIGNSLTRKRNLQRTLRIEEIRKKPWSGHSGILVKSLSSSRSSSGHSVLQLESTFSSFPRMPHHFLPLWEEMVSFAPSCSWRRMPRCVCVPAPKYIAHKCACFTRTGCRNGNQNTYVQRHTSKLQVFKIPKRVNDIIYL